MELIDKVKLEYLNDRCQTIINFMLSKSKNDLFLIKFKNILESTYSKSDLKGIKVLSRDINAWAKSLPKDELKELQIILNDRFDENLSGDKENIRNLRTILVKGKICNKNEFRMVSEYLKDISDNDIFFERIQEMEELLYNYNLHNKNKF